MKERVDSSRKSTRLTKPLCKLTKGKDRIFKKENQRQKGDKTVDKNNNQRIHRITEHTLKSVVHQIEKPKK